MQSFGRQSDSINILIKISFFFFFVCALGIQTFLGQGVNLHHSSDPRHSSDHATSLTFRPPGNAPNFKCINSLIQ